MKILIVGNRMVGDALDSLHAMHSLLVYYQRQGIEVRYDFLGYKYSVAVHEALFTELGLKFHSIFYLDSYIKQAKHSPKHSSKADHKSYPSTTLSWRALKGLIARLGEECYDTAFIMPGGFIFGWITFRAKIRERVGHRTDGRRWFLTRSVPSYKTCPNYENFANILKLLHSSPPFVPYLPRKKVFDSKSFEAQINLKTSSEAAPESFSKNSSSLELSSLVATLKTQAPLTQYYVIASQASESWRAWGHYSELAVYLKKQYQLEALWVGVQSEYEAVEALRQGSGINLCGSLSWDNLLALLGRARFLLTNDTGIAHIGTLLCETFIIFGPSNPTLAAPYARDNYLNLLLPSNCPVPHEKRKMKRYRTLLRINQISMSEVAQPIEEKLKLRKS